MQYLREKRSGTPVFQNLLIPKSYLKTINTSINELLIWVKKIFCQVRVEDPLENHWERDNMGSSEDLANLKRVKIGTISCMV